MDQKGTLIFGMKIGDIVNEVCRMLSFDPDDLHKKGRANDLSYAKGLICPTDTRRKGLQNSTSTR